MTCRHQWLIDSCITAPVYESFIVPNPLTYTNAKGDLTMNILLQVVLLTVGFVMLIKGADWFVDGASAIANRLGIPALIVGLTIVAMGTSAPEAAISISAALKGSADIAVGNVLGSNILNILIILGLTALICPLAVQRSTRRYELPFVIVITSIMALLGLPDGTLNATDGIVLIALFVGYLAYLFYMAKNSSENTAEEDASEEAANMPMRRIIFSMIVGMGLIIWGSDITVDAATAIAKIFGMSERFIGLTVVAFGTSLPEMVTSIAAAIKGKADIAVGNIVGSNIFNILFVLSISSIITPVAYDSTFLFDSILSVGATALLWFFTMNKKRRVERHAGFLMPLCYAGYFVYLIG